MAQKPEPHTIQFSHTSPQQNFRLLELPPELLELVQSENAPTLHLKSQPSATSTNTAASTNQGFVNLCTPTKTYFLRQVHSSNSIFLTKPSRVAAPDTAEDKCSNGEGTTENAGPGQGPDANAVTAIGLCKSTLEVHSIKDAGAVLRRSFRQALHVYDVDDVEADSEMMDVELDAGDENVKNYDTEVKKREAMKELFANVPFSNSECNRTWVEMCAFVHEKKETGEFVCWRPAAQVKLSVWRKMLEGAVLEGIDFGKQFLTRDLWRAVDGGTGSFPRDLFDAIVRRLMEDPSGSEEGYADIKWTNLDSSKVVSWTGEIYLEVTTPNATSAVSRSAFLNGWKDVLPEHLRAEVSLDGVKNCCQRFDTSKVCFKQTPEDQGVRSSAQKPATKSR